LDLGGIMLAKPLLIENHTENGVDWEVGFTCSNPEENELVICRDVHEAQKLIDIISSGYLPKKK
jgi:hypothetical protein